MTNLIVVDQGAGELVTESHIIDKPISMPDLQKLIEMVNAGTLSFPDSFRLYNARIFEVDNFVCIQNNEWLFWDQDEGRYMEWNWEKDMASIYEGEDPQDLQKFNEGWEMFDDGTRVEDNC